MNGFNALKYWRRIAVSLFAVAVSAAFLFALLFADDDAKAQAQTPDTPTPAATTTTSEGNNAAGGDAQVQRGKINPPQYGNMDSLLNDMAQQVEQGISAPSAAAAAPLSSEGAVAVMLLLDTGYSESVEAFLQNNGASPRNVGEGYIEAYVPVSLLAQASQQDGVISITAITPPQPLQGNVVSQGVEAHGADVWQRARLKGENIKIGIIDVGFKDFQEFMGTELPTSENLVALCFTDIGEYTFDVADCDSDSTHGTIVTETAFDIAPKATYYIANPGSWGDLAATTQWMVSQDVDIINHSVGWIWSGPGDGSSPLRTSPENTVHSAVDGGILWVNAAGNEGSATWFGTFNDPDGDYVHNFTADSECNAVLLESEEEFIAQLRWDDTWLRPESDLDLYLINRGSGEVVAKSESFQASYPIPTEVFQLETELKGVYCLVVELFAGPAPDWIQVQAFTSQDIQYYTLGSIGSPAESDSPGMLAAGAADWDDISDVEYFSSRGPTPDGRIKPDIVGVDGGSVAARSRAFYGTSQAAPHVAGLAALVLQNFPDMGPVELAEYLKENALDGGDPGPDYEWGYGLAYLPASDAPVDRCFPDIGDTTGSGFEIAGALDSSCLSEHPPGRGSGDRYARFYTFNLTEKSDVVIIMSSNDFDSYLYLMEGTGKDGDIVDENDDFDSQAGMDSQIDRTLEAGEYTIEATSFDAGVGGDFTLIVEITEAEPQPESEGGFVDVSYGSDHACALHKDGRIACFGSDEHGKATPPDGEFNAVSAGEHGACAIREEDGVVICWGIFSAGE